MSGIKWMQYTIEIGAYHSIDWIYFDAKNTFLLISLCYTQNYFTSFIIETHHIIVESSIPEQAS